MNVKDFDFELPQELIAQTPLEERSASRLMVVNRQLRTIEDKHFHDIIDYLLPGDVLVANNSKVIPARLFGKKAGTGAAIEFLLLKQSSVQENQWEVLIKPGKRVQVGTQVIFGDGRLQATCLDRKEDGIFVVVFEFEGIFLEVLETLGTMPLPPYIKEQLDDQNRYQTVYAKTPGSVAAPTAGLHFTEELLMKLQQKGIDFVDVTLHVGLGTFRPVSVDTIDEHIMHSEYYEMSAETAEILTRAKQDQRRIIAIGTTSTRVLESIWQKHGKFEAAQGWTDIFIYPGYHWATIDGLITNFHLPQSTLMMLVSSLATREFILTAYQHAVDEKYRFFSFGDSMFIM